MGVLSNRVEKESLKPGDHIYSWRTAYIYAHHGRGISLLRKYGDIHMENFLFHDDRTKLGVRTSNIAIYPCTNIGSFPSGIYIGDNKVVHFTRRGQEVGTGTVLDLLLVSSVPARPQLVCPTCTPPEEGHGVVSSCLNCFLSGGVLYRFEYSVNPAHFLAKARGGTCTLAISDPNDVVVHRAKYLLENGFGCYNVFRKNCEDFAIFCKTGLLVVDERTMGQSGQAVSIIGGPLAAVLSTPLRLVTTNVYGMVATAVGVYCTSRYAADIGMRRDVVKISAEDLTRRLANGATQVVVPTLALPALSAHAG